MRPNLSGWMIHSYIVQTELLFLRTYIRQVTQLAEGNLNTGLDANLSHLCLNNIRWVSGVKGRKRREEGVGRRKELVQQIKRSHKQATHISVLLALSMWSRQWHPTPVLLPGKSHGRRSLEGRSPWGRWGLDITERLHFHFSLSCTGEGNGNPLQCSCLANPRDRGSWWAAIYGVAQSQTRLKWLSSSSFVHVPLSRILSAVAPLLFWTALVHQIKLTPPFSIYFLAIL